MIALTSARLRFLDDGELVALMAGAIALRVRTPEDCELLDAIGREFRERKSPDCPDLWTPCARCHLPALLHDPVDQVCPADDDEAELIGVEAVGPEEWERVRPYIFGQENAA